MKKCPNCSREVRGHKNKKFCGQTCKDNFHNRTNPRGYGAKKDTWEQYVESMHPFSSEALGQDN